MEELQNVIVVLKKEHEEQYREMRRDKEVLERMVTDLVRTMGQRASV